MSPGSAMADDVGMTRTANPTPNFSITADIYDLDYARLTHGIHVDTDDRCPLCIADELGTAAANRLDALHADDPTLHNDGGRLHGAFVTNAYRRADLAEMLRDGSATLVQVERSAAFGLSVRWTA